MPRLQLAAGPVEPWWHRSAEDRAAQEQRVREYFERCHPGEAPRPCDCGYYTPGALSYCTEKDRPSCRRNVAERLQDAARRVHEDGLKAKRQLPSLGPTPSRHCGWCKGPIVHGRVGQRAMHDGRLDERDCRWEYELHTRLEVQRAHLLERDGPACRACGTVHGRWKRHGETDPARLRSWGVSFARRFPEDEWVGPFCSSPWSTFLEVDHTIALAVAWVAFQSDARRLWFFSPANLALRCAACHARKTRDDMALLKACRERGPEWARAEVLRRLSDAGLLRAPASKRSPHGMD